ncbi:Uncharacterised protein [Vibrio cholerae]|uniref:Uncharacterized protein n=1 Tax=Vibrio cholerae TaxID=666 RepID=A0A655Q9F5_VIBCL|nr:Uncharacterised protein [Vibrio cholerae]CSA64165.1 Uncharacterised protein [Vibrio cholerae]CSC08774.1 Uncharacterised protein [Vibrio cholerae]CSD19610.1 Uncharacterised protein [Vibrio cholerae]
MGRFIRPCFECVAKARCEVVHSTAAVEGDINDGLTIQSHRERTTEIYVIQCFFFRRIWVFEVHHERLSTRCWIPVVVVRVRCGVSTVDIWNE